MRPAANIRILEVAVLVSDKNYQPLDRGKSFIVHWPLTASEIASEMSERYMIPSCSAASMINPEFRVREMHVKVSNICI